MIFNRHSEFAPDDHAFLSPSKYHWVNDSDEKLEERFYKYDAAKRGTLLHEFAKQAILLKRKQPKTNDALNMFVNDAIGFGMTPEVMLVYSPMCFGTTDAISFTRGVLRIHDYKSGVTACKMTQLELYAALFCLEYDINPLKIKIELRIYQNRPGEAPVIVHNPPSEDIAHLMKIVTYKDNYVNELRSINS